MNKRLINTIPFLMPVGPAIVLAMTIYKILAPPWPYLLAAAVAIILASLFEVSGYYIAHGFIVQVEADNRWRWVVNLLFLMVFVGCGVGIIVWGQKDIGSDLVAAILAAFPVLASMVYITQGMRLSVDHRQVKIDYREDAEWEFEFDLKGQQEQAKLTLEREKEQAKLDIKRERATAQIASKYAPNSVRPGAQLDGNSTILDGANVQRLHNVDDRLDAALAYVDENPDASYRQIGLAIGKSKSSGENYAKSLMEAGRLKRNGQGWEVISK